MSGSSYSADRTPKIGDIGHERPAIDVRGTLIAAAIVGVMVVLSCIASREIYRALVRPTNDRSLTPMDGQGLLLPVAPRLEGIEMMSSAGTSSAVIANDDRLTHYGWIDREKRVVHIPIQRAMELAIDRGWLRSAVRGDDNTEPARVEPAKANQNDSPK